MPMTDVIEGTYFRELQPVRHVVGREDDLRGASTTGSHRLLTQPSNPQHLTRDGQFTGHGNSWVERVIQCQRKE